MSLPALLYATGSPGGVPVTARPKHAPCSRPLAAGIWSWWPIAALRRWPSSTRSPVTVVTRLRGCGPVYPGPASVRPSGGSTPLQREPITRTPSGRPGYALANHDDPSLVWPPAAHRGGLPSGITPAYRPCRFDGSSSEIPTTPLPPKRAVDPSVPLAPADPDLFYAAWAVETTFEEARAQWRPNASGMTERLLAPLRSC